MKKLYSVLSVTVLFSLAFINSAVAQYATSRSGNWSSNLTWAPGAKPAATCNNCTITISSGNIVTLDAAVTLTGTTKMVIADNAKLIIPSSGNNTFAAHNSITLAFSGATGPTIQLVTSTSTIDATGAGRFDGIFEGNLLGGLVTVKTVGVSPSVFVFGLAIPGTPNPVNGPALSGPVTLNANGTLPVVLTNFNASYNDGSVNVTWTTEIELNTDHFEIQRSTNGVDYATVGTVAAKGNSSVELNYSFNDPAPVAGYNYYRLKSVDKDAKFTYSEIKVVSGSAIQSLKVFPNPTRDFVNVSISSHVTGDIVVRLINQSGQVLNEKRASKAGGTIVSMSVSKYPQGNYLIQVSGTDGSKETRKLLITK